MNRESNRLLQERLSYDRKLDALATAFAAARLTFRREDDVPEVDEVADMFCKSFVTVLYRLWLTSVARWEDAANYYQIEGQEPHLDLPYQQDDGINLLRLTSALFTDDSTELFQYAPDMFSLDLQLMVENHRSPQSYQPFIELAARHIEGFIAAMRRSGPRLEKHLGAWFLNGIAC